MSAPDDTPEGREFAWDDVDHEGPDSGKSMPFWSSSDAEGCAECGAKSSGIDDVFRIAKGEFRPCGGDDRSTIPR